MQRTVRVCDLMPGDVYVDEGKKRTVSAIKKTEEQITVWIEEAELPVIYTRQLIMEPVLKKVTNVFRGVTYEWTHVETNGETLTCTREHPFYVEGKGWVEAGKLVRGDVLKTINGPVSVDTVWFERLDEPQTTYNIEVEGSHNYLVGNSGILVHNKCVAKEGKLRAVVKNGGDPNHLHTAHAHILDGSTDVASVLADGSVFSGQLTRKTADFVTRHIDEIATGINQYYWIGR